MGQLLLLITDCILFVRIVSATVKLASHCFSVHVWWNTGEKCILSYFAASSGKNLFEAGEPIFIALNYDKYVL